MIKAVSPSGGNVVVYFDPISLRACPIIAIQNTHPSDNIPVVNKITVVTGISNTLLLYLNEEIGRSSNNKNTDFALIEFDYIPGVPISVLMGEVQVDDTDLIYIARQIYSGLDNVHNAGYINGDLANPQNILVDLDTLHTTIVDFESQRYTEEGETYDVQDIAFLLWEVVTRGNGSFIINGKKSKPVAHRDDMFPEMFEDAMKNYPEYDRILYVLLEIFTGRITTASEVLGMLE